MMNYKHSIEYQKSVNRCQRNDPDAELFDKDFKVPL